MGIGDFFSNAISAVGNFLGTPGGGAVTELIGAGAGAIANDRAVGAYSDGLQKSTEEARRQFDLAMEELKAGKVEALDRIDLAQAMSLGFIDQGTAAALGELQKLSQMGQGGMNYMQRELTTDPSQLTASQKIGLEDTTRQTVDNLATSGLRGSARAQTAILGDAQRRFKAQAEDQNRGRAERAATFLSGLTASSGASKANLMQSSGNQKAATTTAAGGQGANAALGTGTAAANLNTGLGKITADNFASEGLAKAQGSTATGSLVGDALGAIGGLAREDAARKRYESRLAGITAGE